MSGVTDVTDGARVFLEDDDVAMLQISHDGNTVTTSVVSFDTSDSKLSHDPHTAVISRFETKSNFDPKKGIIASQAVGRMYNTRSDLIAIVNAVDDGAPHWSFTLFDPLTKFTSTGTMNSEAGVYGTVSTQAVMGDFNGDGLADPLMFYSSVDTVNGTHWGMRVLTAEDPKKEGTPIQGPEFASRSSDTLPVTGTIVVGDFNNDGRDEIALLRKDLRTIVFYTVNPKDLTISETTSPMHLPITMRAGQVALAAGRFRSQDPGPTNADLVVFGQIDDSHSGYSVIPVRITPNQDGTFTPKVVGDSFFRFTDYHGASGALAQAASLVYWPRQIYQQLVLGIKTDDGASFIEIGSFEQDDTLSKFNWESETKRDHEGASFTFLQNIWVGNFDNKGSDGTHSPGLQIETYESVFNGFPGNFEPHVMIFDVAAPAPPNPVVTKPGNWLKEKSNNTSNIPLVSDLTQEPSMNVVVPGDFQGRSLRLGAPTIVRIKAQIQPDLVLAIPPMHVDWIAPNTDVNNLSQPGCTDAGTPCIMNLSVLPTLPPSVQAHGFSTNFVFASSANSSAKHSSTTSWGVSVKETAETKATFGDGLTEGNLDIKNTAKYAHDNTVKKKFNTYKGKTDQLSATTGFADHIFFSRRGMNVYYYPVLGCESDGSNCTTNNQKLPLYVEFSVPDEIYHSDVDGTSLDWYQPLHEPGNVFSYPWSLTQLENQFGDKVDSLTTTPQCMATDTSSQTATTQWTQGSSESSSSGSTNSFSDELSMSYSVSAGVEGIDAASFTAGLDIAGSTSLNTLNESVSSLSSSKGITINKPVFGYPSQCCNYAFGQYIFGLKNTKHPASEEACHAGQTPEKDHCVALDDPEGNAINIASTGPLFTGYIANPLDGSNSDLTCAGHPDWWTGVYNKPDIALNHPQRWYWNIKKQQVFFNNADQTGKISILDQSFYAMKGFFITLKNEQSGPNLGEATAGDQLTLTTRIYNYSVANTTGPIHVRFYGQRYCSSGGTEASCMNGSNTCTAGTLCGDSFYIGESQIQAISGFKANGGNDPNWKLTSVDFDTSNYARSNLVFWVVAWMEDGSGKLVPEMPGHGLKQIPGATLKQISDVPIETYSNNVGMYGVNQKFYILPKTTGLEAEQSGGKLQSIELSVDSQAPLGERTKVVAHLQAAGASVDNVNIAYYDGDPAKGGILLDVQKIANIEPGERYYHRAFFAPQSCGVHTLYASAWTADSPDVQASSATTVGASSQEYSQDLINSTQSARLADTQMQSQLLDLLNGALKSFQQGNTQAAQMALSRYIQQLTAAGADSTKTSQLTGQANTLLGCTPIGFLVTALPSSAQINAGDTASYELALTPTGGFQGPVALTCSGQPQGASCSVSTQTINLDGKSQSRLTVQISTTERTTTAGIGRMTSADRHSWKWISILLLNLLSIVILQQARLKGNSMRLFLMLLVVSGLIGCGGSGSGGSTPTGRYAVTVQATSGNTTQNTELALIVK